MKTSFWELFLVLDYCYSLCKEDDLGGILGAISPDLWCDDTPADKAIVSDWEHICAEPRPTPRRLMEYITQFLLSYEQKYGFCLSETKNTLNTLSGRKIAELQKEAAIKAGAVHKEAASPAQGSRSPV